MTSARWCPQHSLVMEELWEGLRCPAGHNHFVEQRQGAVYWVVDIDLEPSNPRWKLATMLDGHLEWADWFENGEGQGGPSGDYLEHREHWARRKSQNKSQWTMVQRVVAGKI